MFAPGPGVIPTADTAYGRLATAICFDLNYPTTVRQVGQARADLVLVPASDWDSAKFTHAQMHVFRAIENGASMVRPTGQGISLAVDALGRVRGEVDYYATDEAVLVAAVPTQGVWTFYPVIGDIVAYLCATGLLAVTGLAVFHRWVAERAVLQPAYDGEALARTSNS